MPLICTLYGKWFLVSVCKPYNPFRLRLTRMASDQPAIAKVALGSTLTEANMVLTEVYAMV